MGEAAGLGQRLQPGHWGGWVLVASTMSWVSQQQPQVMGGMNLDQNHLRTVLLHLRSHHSGCGGISFPPRPQDQPRPPTAEFPPCIGGMRGRGDRSSLTLSRSVRNELLLGGSYGCSHPFGDKGVFGRDPGSDTG